MKILIVNDDGYMANGIKMLVDKAKKYGEVIVYSPYKCESAQSHKITIKTGIEIEEVSNLGVKAYAVHGSAADCVRVALFNDPNIDLILSGVNEGLNIGHDVFYSSTVAAISQAGLLGKRGIALSYDKNVEDVEPQLEALLDELILNNSKYSDLINVNFPIAKFKKAKGIKMTIRGEQSYGNSFDIINGAYFEKMDLIIDNTPGVDSEATNNGYISISNLSMKRTYI